MRIIRTKTLGIRVDAVAASDATTGLLDRVMHARSSALFTFVNPASVTVAEHRPRYRQLLDEFDVVLPDGIGMCWAVRMLHGVPAARVSFDTTSLAPAVFQRACQELMPVALVGGRPGVAERAALQLCTAFPGLNIPATLDGYGDLKQKIHEIKALSPSIVICGMGTGFQEEFLAELAEAGWSGIGFTCGGYLDQLGNGLDYYPGWIDATNLRWAYRLAKEPRRLGRRYLVDYTYFAANLGHALMVRRGGRGRQPMSAEDGGRT